MVRLLYQNGVLIMTTPVSFEVLCFRGGNCRAPVIWCGPHVRYQYEYQFD